MKTIIERNNERKNDTWCVSKNIETVKFGIYDVLVRSYKYGYDIVKITAISCIDAENIAKRKGYEVLDSDFSCDN